MIIEKKFDLVDRFTEVTSHRENVGLDQSIPIKIRRLSSKWLEESVPEGEIEIQNLNPRNIATRSRKISRIS